MRIVSLLPSATEIAFELGLADDLVGVSCDCDFPPEASSKPVVSSSTLAVDAATPPSDVDALVRERVAEEATIYRLDRDLIRRLSPDLILAQDLCRVCAVPSGHVTEALETIGVGADVISLDPHSLDDVIRAIEEVADATGTGQRGRSIVDDLRARIDRVRMATSDLSPVRSLALEWVDPPFSGGHWVPEMVRLAGGKDVLGVEGAPSRTCAWREVAGAAPDVVVFMPCGYGLEGALAQAESLKRVPELRETPAAENGAVFAVDGSSYFSRPGPRLVDGLEILAWILHPGAFPEPPPGRVARIEM